MALDGFDRLTAAGQSLLDSHDPVRTHSDFNSWVSQVSNWLNNSYPNSGLSADWAAQGDSNLVVGGGYYNDPTSWSIFRMRVQGRLRWLGQLPLKIQLVRLSAPALAQNEAKQTGRKEIKLQTVSRAYVDPDRINELKTLQNPKFDLAKIVRLCEEVNICFAGECYLAIIVLTRALLDHVPPIFECRSFSEVANNYSGARVGRNNRRALRRMNIIHPLITRCNARCLLHPTRNSSIRAIDVFFVASGPIRRINALLH